VINKVEAGGYNLVIERLFQAADDKMPQHSAAA
jgi:hypothetical protein